MTTEVEKNPKSIKYLPLLYDGLNENLRSKAGKELNETEENRRKGLKDLRDFIKKSNLPSELDDDTLLNVLRAAKYDLQKSRDKLAGYCSMRRKKVYLQLLELEKVLFVLDRKIIGILPYRDSEGTAMIYFRMSAWHPGLCAWEDVAGSVFSLVHFALTFPATSVCGVTLISNGQTEYLSIFTYLSYAKAHIYDGLAVPLRIKRLIAFNVNWVCRFCTACILPLLPQKLRNRLQIYKGGISVPGDLCPPSILPNEFGGTMGPLSNDHFRDRFVHFFLKLKEEDSIY